MAGTLEFIKKQSATSAVSMDVTDVFTADYEVYQVHISADMDSAAYFELRLLNASDDSLANSSQYDMAAEEFKSNTTFNDYKFEDQNGGVGWRGIGPYIDDGDGYGFTATIFNPFIDGYTMAIAQGASSNGASANLEGQKSIAAYKDDESIGGFRVINSGGGTMNYIVATVYGVK